MPILGPTRLILIRSGTFDFADVDLTRPLHLVGPNNVGKTTLVNLLQFLYVDRVNHMSFAGYSTRETRRYYFPERHSYVLFECQTPEGLRVFGVHGTGPAESYDIQRFAYKGAWARSDFLTEDDAPRPIDEVKPELALKDLRLLEARHLRAALTGVGDSKSVNLGLVPVQSRHGYERFRKLFKGLIRLRHLDPDTLKSTLCETYAAELGALSVDLKTDYADQFDKMQDQRDAVERLERIEEDIRRVLSLHEKRHRLRTDAREAWNRLTRTAAHVQAALAAEATDTEQAMQDETQARSRLQKKERTLDGKRDALIGERATVESQLKRLHAAVDATPARSPDDAKQNLSRAQQKQASLRAKVQSIDADDPKRIRRRLEHVKKSLEQRQRRLANLEDLVGPMLRKEMGEARMRRLFRVLNPEMLDLNQNGPHVDVTDRAALLSDLRRLDDELAETPWTASWGTLSLDGLTPPSLAKYIDPERIRGDIRGEKQESERLQERLRIAENRSALEEEADVLQGTINELQAVLRHHQEAQTAAAEIPGLRTQKKNTEENIAAVTRERDAVRDAIRACDGRIRAAKTRQRRVQRDQRTLQTMRKGLQAPPSEWGTPEAAEAPADDAAGSPPGFSEDEGNDSAEDRLSAFRSEIEAYGKGAERERQTDDQLQRALRRIHRQTTAQYERDTLHATLGALREELEGLAQRRNAAERMWQQLMTGLGRKLNDLLESLHSLKSNVSAINRRLRGTSVSDLKRLKLVVSPIDEMVRLLKRTAEQNALPLFGDAAAHAEDVKRLDAMLRTHPSIHLTDLFNVAFEVETVDGTVKSYDGLRSIESNGTSISIKVLVHLVLINDLLSDTERTLPFYLDEASSLDEQNLVGIVRAAQHMGFVPILASPTESTAVEHLYYVRSTGDRVYLGLDQRVRLQPASDVQAKSAPALA